MKRKIFIPLMLSAFLLFSGCGLVDQVLNAVTPTTAPGKNAPSRMVTEISVAIHPEDPQFTRHYYARELVETLLTMLRDMDTGIEPEEEPKLDDGQSYYAITLHYASGDTQDYYLLGHRYLRLGDAPWCAITPEQAETFVRFIRDYPDDETFLNPPTEAPTAVPTETAPPQTT